MRVGNSHESKSFKVRLRKGEGIDKFLDDGRLGPLLAQNSLGEVAMKKDVIITVEFDIKKAR